jgi:hypothetical protein
MVRMVFCDEVRRETCPVVIPNLRLVEHEVVKD